MTLPESQRLPSLQEINIPGPGEAYDQITQMASQVAQTTVAYISLINDRREWVKSRVGIDALEIPLRDAPLSPSHTDPNDHLLTRNFTNSSSSFFSLKSGRAIKFFYSTPIRDCRGQVIGNLCVLDYMEKKLSEAQVYSLEYLATLIAEKILTKKNEARSVLSGEASIVPSDNILQLIKFLPNVLIRTTLAGEVMMISPASQQVLGYSPEELIGNSFARLYAEPDSRQQLVDYLQSYGYVNDFHTQLICKDGNIKDISISAQLYCNEAGEMIGIEGVMNDITKIVQSQKKEKALKEFYEKTLNAIKADIAVLDDENRYYFLNRHAVKNDENRALLIGKTNSEYFALKNKSPELAIQRELVLNEVAASDKKVEWLEQYVDAAGEPVYKLCIGETFETNEGETFKVAYGIDVTRLKKTELKLAENEQYLTSLISSIPDLILRMNADGVYLDFKTDSEQSLGVDTDAILGKTLFDVFDKETASYHLQHILQALKTGKIITYEYEINTSGEARFFEARVSRIRDEEVIAIVRDITDRKISEKQIKEYTDLLQESEQSLERLIYSAPKGIMVMNSGGEVLLWNPMCESIFSTTEKDMRGKNFCENFIVDDDQPVFRQALASLADNESEDFRQTMVEVQAVNQAARSLKIKVTVSESVIDGQDVFVGFVSDITREREAEAMLKRKQSQLVEAQHIAKIASFEWNLLNDEIEWSDNVSGILGLEPPVQAPGMDELLNFIHIDDLKFVKDRLSRLEFAETIEPLHFRILTPAGAVKYVVASGYAVKNDLSKKLIIGTLQDVSAQKLFDRQLFKAVIESEERERNRIAAELHDGVCQDLAAAKLGLQIARKNFDTDRELSEKLMSQVAEGIALALDRTSKVSHDLLPADLKHEGLATSLQNLVAKLKSIDSIGYTLSIKGKVKEPEPLIAVNLYRITQEFIRNSQKHSGADKLTITLDYFDDKLQLKLRDNGKGFDMEGEKKDGIGFINMSKRIQSIGGNFNLYSRPGKGVLLSLSVPLS